MYTCLSPRVDISLRFIRGAVKWKIRRKSKKKFKKIHNENKKEKEEKD